MAVAVEVRHREPDGKERSRTFRTKKETERYARNQQTAVDAGTWIDPTAGKTTLGQWANEWQRTVVHLRSKTRKIYADNLRLHILPVLGDHELAELTPSMLRAWLADLASRPGVRGEVLSSASVSQAYRTLVLVAAYTGLRASELVGLRRLRTYATPPPTRSCSSRPRAATSASTTSGALDRYGHLFPGQAEPVADRLDEMAQAAGIVQRADVIAIDLGRS